MPSCEVAFRVPHADAFGELGRHGHSTVPEGPEGTCVAVDVAVAVDIAGAGVAAVDVVVPYKRTGIGNFLRERKLLGR
jgi:hypothetical protein